MSEPKCYPTGWKRLNYRNDAEAEKGNRWRFVDAASGKSIGPVYKSRSELLASCRPFALTNGYRVKEPADVAAEAKPAPPPGQMPIKLIPVGMTADHFWQLFAKSHGLDKAPADVRDVMRLAFMYGFASMVDVTARVGEPDVDGTDGMVWIENLRREAQTAIGEPHP